MKSTLRGLKTLLTCFLVLASLPFFQPLRAQMCLPTWKYRLPVVINNAGNPALSDYQVKITLNTANLVSGGKMAYDGRDIRFTADDCCTPVCHWVQKGMNTTTTTIWVKVPALPAGGLDTIYLHYGDSTQVSNADGSCVFEFFDDFSGSSLDPVKWTTRGTPSSLTVSGGQMTIIGNSNWEYIRSNTSFSSKVKIHDNRKHQNLTGSAGLVMGYTGTDNRFTFRYNSANLGMAVTNDNDVFSGNAWYNQTYPLLPYPTASFNEFEITAEITAGNVIQLTNYCNVTAANCNSNTTLLSAYTGSSFYVGYSSYSNITAGYSDYIFVRKFTATDPSFALGSEFSMPARPLASTPDDSLCAGTTRTLNAGAGHFSFLWNDGTNSQNATFNFPPQDTIWCQIIDGMGCQFTDTAIFTVLALPADFISPAADTVCPGNSVTFDADSVYVNWSWNTGDSTQTITVNTVMDYIATVEDIYGCIGSDTASLANFIPVTVAITPDSPNVFCSGDTLLLDAGSGFLSYLWNTGDSTQTLVIDSSGTYSVMVTDSNSCSSVDSVAYTEVPNPVVVLIPDSVTVCEGTQVCIDAQAGWSCYIWNTGENTQVICPVMAGIYSVTICDANGCMGSDTATLNFYPPVNAVITQSGNTLTATSGIAWQWLMNGSPLAGETNQSYTAIATGNYACIITDSNGCSDTSNVITFTVGLTGSVLSQLKLYPNPARDRLNIEAGSMNGTVEWKLISITGSVLNSGSEAAGNFELSLNGLAAGVYFIHLENQEGSAKLKFVKE